MNSCQKYFTAGVLALLTQAAFAQSGPSLGSVSNFAVLSAAPAGLGAVTCTQAAITGDVGSSGSAASVVQTEGCFITGAVIAPVNPQVLTDFNTAYDALAPKPADVCPIITGTLSGQSLAPGVYCVSSEAKTGVLTLDGPADGTWLFKVAPGAFTGTDFSVVMAGGAQACNVIWWVDAATTMTDSNLKGTVLAGAAITTTRGTFTGRALAKATVTMTGTAMSGCAAQTGPGAGACSDRVTGGGYIISNGKKANLGVTAGIRKDKFRGHLTYIDHGIGLKVKGTGVTAYTVVNAKTRHIEGTAMINGVPGAYAVDVTDNGEPGRNDSFSIVLSTGYKASGKLAGGNIQLHKKHCDKGDKGHDGHDQGGDDEDDHDHDDGDHGEKDRGHTAKPYGSDDKKRK